MRIDVMYKVCSYNLNFIFERKIKFFIYCPLIIAAVEQIIHTLALLKCPI